MERMRRRKNPTSQVRMKRSDDAAVVVAFGIGSNLGDREVSLAEAARMLASALIDARISSPYVSAPLEEPSQPPFLNAAIVARTQIDPDDLIGLAKAIEWAGGRRRGPRFGPRPVDVDLLLYGDVYLRRPELTLPHPRMREREFVLGPLAEIAPDLEIPPDGATVASLLAEIEGRQGIEKIGWSLPC